MKHSVLLLSLGFCLFGTLYASVSEDEYPQVRITDGILNGAYLTTVNNRKISGFTGIPFAKPPLGNLRFQAPRPNDPWTGERNATGAHAECPQRNTYLRSEVISGEEDCLYLNVYTPKLSGFENGLLPVMFWIHGGGLLCGSGNINQHNPAILLDKDIVLVSTNYRLGPLGFLATGDDIAPGNNGLKDQAMALNWVKKNIAKFGGDPDQVTIFGQSAGATSVDFHIISPLSKGLFKQAISESGTTLCGWTLSENNETINNTNKLAKALNCPTDSSKDMVDCLRKIDARKIIEQDKIFEFWHFDPMIPFKPVVEPKTTKNPFLSDHPLNIMKSGGGMDVPMIIGLNSEDGAIKTAGIKGGNLLDEFAENIDEILPVSLFYGRTEIEYKKITDEIKKFYFQGKKIQDSLKEITDVYTDGWFLNCLETTARLRTKYYRKPVYFYLFSYRGGSSLSKVFGSNENFGIIHGDEMLYLFPFGFVPTEKDKEMSLIMTSLWTNFAYFGNPTPDKFELIDDKWSSYTLENGEYFQIDNVSETKRHIFKQRADFWRALLNNPLLESDDNKKDEL
ncbi:unnamed protein product [Phyllotreta striolata]|uniref:Carboxylic ester hydrolase n=1 Tax=Phyllotreta striolata TaxID=444603 RepID=A0A9N9XM02_PHYSR|nr:unnamed protein product [Phyllotreta striolata]